MSNESQSGKGFRFQTLKAIELFLDALKTDGKDAEIFVAVEKIGDIYFEVNNEIQIWETKNYTSSLSINSQEIRKTIYNFLKIYTENNQFNFVFCSTDDISNDTFPLETPILQYLQDKNPITDEIIEYVKTSLNVFIKKEDKKTHHEHFNSNDWLVFLSKIKWIFNNPNNLETKNIITEKLKFAINQINPNFLNYNGLETSIRDEIINELEAKKERNNPKERFFSFLDFERLLNNELIKRSLQTVKHYSKFQKLQEKRLLPENEIFFTSKETNSLNYITNQLLFTKNRNFVLLTGKSGVGKSVLAQQVGFNLLNNNFLVLQIDLTPNIDYSDLELEKISRENNFVFCIISKAHLNLTVIEDVIHFQSRYQNIKCLFESRPIDRNLDETDLLNQENLVHIQLEFSKASEFTEKYLGIINKNLPKEKSSQVNIKELLTETGRNFLILKEYLNILRQDIDISKLKQTLIKKYAHSKYDLLKKYAIINQYEISVNCTTKINENNFKKLVDDNQLFFADKQGDNYYYNLYHADFAKIIAEIYFLENKYTGIQSQEITKKKLIDYLIETDLKEIPVVFKSLFTNKEITLIKTIFLETSFQERIFEFYSDPENFKFEFVSSKSLRDLLLIIPVVVPELLVSFLQKVIIEKENINYFFQNDNSAIFTLLKLSSLIQEKLPNKIDVFNQKLPNIFEVIPLNISFSAITYYLAKASQDNSVFFNILKAKFTTDYLAELAKDEEFLTATEGFVHLYKLTDYQDFSKNYVFDLEKTFQVPLNRYAKALLNLNRIAPRISPTELFLKYPENLLIQRFSELDIRTILTVANQLRSFGYDKIYKNLSIHKLNIDLKEFSFSEISEILIEANKFIDSKKNSKEFIGKIDNDLLIDKFKNEDFYFASQYLHRLHNYRGYKEKIEELFKSIPIVIFNISKANIEDFRKIEILHHLSSIENKPVRIKQIFFNNKPEIEKIDFNKFTFERQILVFTYLKVIDLNEVTKIAHKNKESLLEKSQTASLKEIGKSLIQLYDVLPDVTYQILSNLVNSNNFLNYLNSSQINLLSRTLKEFSIVEKKQENHHKLTTILLEKVNSISLTQNIKNVGFATLCDALYEIFTIENQNYHRIRKLVWEIGNEPFLEKMNKSKFIGLCNGLMNLNKVNYKFTQSLINEGYERIVDIAINSELKDLSDGLKALESFVPQIAKSIFDKADIQMLAQQTQNYRLDIIKKCLYFLKTIKPENTQLLLSKIDTESLSFKFQKEKQFYKAAEYLSQIYKIDNKKIEDVVTTIGISSLR